MPFGFSAYKSKALFPITVRAENNADALWRRPCQGKCTHCHKFEALPDIKQVQAAMAVAAAGWDPAALRTEQRGNRAHSGRSRD
jgi:hypothetical protein